MLQTIPDYRTTSKILLEIMQKDRYYSLEELVDIVTRNLNLQQCDLNLKTKCGRQTLIKNRVIFAKTYLIKQDLMIKTKDKKYSIVEN